MLRTKLRSADRRITEMSSGRISAEDRRRLLDDRDRLAEQLATAEAQFKVLTNSKLTNDRVGAIREKEQILVMVDEHHRRIGVRDIAKVGENVKKLDDAQEDLADDTAAVMTDVVQTSAAPRVDFGNSNDVDERWGNAVDQIHERKLTDAATDAAHRERVQKTKTELEEIHVSSAVGSLPSASSQVYGRSGAADNGGGDADDLTKTDAVGDSAAGSRKAQRTKADLALAMRSMQMSH